MEIEKTASQSRNIRTRGAPRNSDLPQELIEEILLQLPVKSLWRFRLVSKSWRSLIESKRFIKKHLQYSTRNTSLAHHRVLLAYQSIHESSRYTLLASRRAYLSHFSLLSLFNTQDVHPLEFNFPTDVHPVEFNFPTDVPPNSISLVGCCDGLVCALLNDEQFTLWNPSTRIFKNLPPTCKSMERFRCEENTSYGFGYDESSGDYKVFWCVRFNNKSAYTLYSLKNGSWKRTNFVDTSLHCCEQGKLASGKLHWQGSYTQRRPYISFNSSDKWEIVSFDISREEFGAVEQPCYSEGKFRPYLGKVGECLSVVCNYDTCIHVWVMKEYGVKESWEKVNDVSIQQWTSRYRSLCIGPEGEIVLRQGEFFWIYYKDRFWRLGMGELSVLDEADIYVESLVSLFPDQTVREEGYLRQSKRRRRRNTRLEEF